MMQPHKSVDFVAVNEAAMSILPDLLRRWLSDGKRHGKEWVARNPRRADRRMGSFCVNMDTGRCAYFSTGDKGGDVVSLAAYLAGVSQVEAARNLADMLGVG